MKLSGMPCLFSWSAVKDGLGWASLCTVAMLFFSTAYVAAADGMWIMSTNLNLPPPGKTTAYWNSYSGGDAPEGAYMGWMFAGATQLAATVALPAELPPGDYRVFVKLIDYDGKPGRVQATLSGDSGAVSTSNDDWNKYWTAPIVLHSREKARSISITLIKTLASEATQKYLLRGIYITPNPAEDVANYGYDRIVNYVSGALDLNGQGILTEATSTRYLSTAASNLLPNGSFELPIGQGWSFNADGGFRNTTIRTSRIKTEAVSGDYAFQFAVRGELTSRIIRLRAGKQYTFSAMARCDTTSGIAMRLNPIGDGPDTYGKPISFSKVSTIKGGWVQVSVSGVPNGLLDCYYVAEIYANPGTTVDDLCLVESADSSVGGTGRLEAALGFEAPCNVFLNDEPLRAQVYCYNPSASPVKPAVQYEIYDLWNRQITKGSINLDVPARQSAQGVISLPPKTGIFRAITWISGIEDSLDESIYSVIFPPNANPSLTFGIHPNLADYQLSLEKRMGISAVRLLSPSSTFRWAKIEKSPGVITWDDEGVNKAVAAGMTILGTIGSNREWPAWADQNGMPNLDLWEDFVAKIVSHYKGRVGYWEIWNEPIYTFQPEFYASMLKRAAAAIRRTDPNAKIVAMGGVYSKDWILQVMNILGAAWKDQVDIISTHQYPPGTDPSGGETDKRSVAFKKEIIDKYDVPVWNTETGVWDEGFYKTRNANYAPIGSPIWPHLNSERFVDGCYYEAERMMENLLHSVGNGQKAYFYYDSRIYITPYYQKSHPTILDFDDSVKAKGIVYSIAASRLDQYTGGGNISADANVFAYLFTKSDRLLVAFWSNDALPRLIPAPSVPYTLEDVTGNGIAASGGNLPIGRTPQYLSVASGNETALRSLFGGSLRKSVDAVAPAISIDEFPTGPTAGGASFRWLAIDDTSIPSESDPFAVRYSYRLAGREENWSNWDAGTEVSYFGLAPGSYSFEVRAEDEAGNISPIASRRFAVLGGIAPVPPKNISAK